MQNFYLLSRKDLHEKIKKNTDLKKMNNIK